MKLTTTLLPLLILPFTASAIPAPAPAPVAGIADVVNWAADQVVEKSMNGGDGEMRTMDSWSYVDCGESS